MFPIPLRSSKSERNLRKLKKGDSWTSKCNKIQLPTPDPDSTALQSQLLREDVAPTEAPTLARARSISIRTSKRDTILIDLTNNDLRPALDYAFAILDADDVSACPTSSSPPPKSFFNGSSLRTSNASCPPSSIRSTPPRYIYVVSPLSSSSGHSSLSSVRSSSQKCSATPIPDDDEPFDPHELSRALSHAQEDNSHEPTSPDTPSSPSVPFPPPATPPVARIPLLQRKPRLLHSAESSIDGHESFMSRHYHSPSNVSLVRSVSSLDHCRDLFGSRGALSSSTSVNTIDSGLAALFSQQPRSSSSLKLFPSPKKSRPTPPRRASTPPPSRGGLGLAPMRPPARPPVPTLPDIFLLSPAARREASSDSNTLLSRCLT